MRTENTISLAIVDDHPLILSGLAALIESEPSFTLLGQGANGLDAVVIYQGLRPDVMLIDLNMPACGGIEAITRIRKLDAGASIVILTAHEGEEDVYRALQAGASAYLLKNCGFEQIVRCVRQVATKRSYLPEDIAAKLVRRVDADALSARELDILTHLASGKSNKLIARAAGIGVGTVKFHVNNILTKLQVSCRTEAACVAFKRGLIQPYF